jgi:uncharacterized protein (TIGR02680 family)
LPRPQRERWQPLRSGFVNLYRYDREEFHYESGRLLLRGNNGTGKSRVLALQLPFLLDGEVNSQRLEPDADPARRIEWNLLMGRYPDRTGYTWIEFGRRDPGGQEHFVTLGCGLSAVEGQSGVRRWFFITSQRIGLDLELSGDGKQVFGKDRLRERIASHGQVYESAGAYRRAVNDALFHLDDYRYASFVNLLIQLRRPQLTRRLDEEDLSGALSEALPPVSPAVIGNVAEAFRNLESERGKLESFKVAMTAVNRFLTSYRSYARVAARRAIDHVRTAHREYETGMKDILQSEADCDRSLAELARLKTEIQRITSDQHSLEAEIAALQQRPEIRDAEGIERAHREALEKRMEAESAAAETADAVRVRKSMAEEYVRSKAHLEGRQDELASAAEAALQAAACAGMEHLHRESFGVLDPARPLEDVSWQGVRDRVETAIQRQTERIAHLRKLDKHASSARMDLQESDARREQLSGLLDDARERLSAAEQQHNTAVATFLEAIQKWHGDCKELLVPIENDFPSEVAAWCHDIQDTNPFAAAVQGALAERTREFAEQRAQLQMHEKTLSRELSALTEERDQAEFDAATAGNTHNDETNRPGTTGSPFALLCDFIDGLDTASKGAIEGALEAAGILNAWVTPSGELVDPQNGNTVLVAGSGPLPAPDAHLGTILVPSIRPRDGASAVPPFVVADVLRHIGAKPNAGHTWVSADGRWQDGMLHGCWKKKQQLEHSHPVGRRISRHERILELDAAILDTRRRLDALVQSIEEIHRREGLARTEARTAPDDEHVRVAFTRALAAHQEVDRLRQRLAEAEAQRAPRQTRLDEALDKHRSAVRDLGIDKWVNDLDSLERAISGYRLVIGRLLHAAESASEARKTSRRIWALVEEAGCREGRLRETAERLDRSATSAETAYRIVRGSTDAGLDNTLEQLHVARERLDELQSQERDARRQHHDAELAVTRVDERLRNLTEMLNGQTERWNAAASALRGFAATKLLSLAVPGFSDAPPAQWSTPHTVEVAFDLASRLDLIETGDSVWEHYQKSIPAQFNELMQVLSAQGCQPSATFCNDVFVATCVFAGRDCSMEELHDTLSGEVQAGQMLMNAREKEILENQLVSEVSSHLHELIRAAENQVREMNAELETRPMSTGMKLRFVWRPLEDGPQGLADMRSCLMRSEGWTLADREILGAFLHRQIQAMCSQMEGGSWQESLAEALDYRKWHRFGVERCQDGVWKRLTRRTHGTGSGGEKAVALILPHFAAAAAFYRTADRLAPRLILLDEAFVGIDAAMRAKCMGLIHSFDLDFIMTSEREWGCYSTIPGLAVYQLSTRPGIDAIGLTRWVWNGQQRILKKNVAGTEEAALKV